MKQDEKQICSREVYDILVQFNRLPSFAEQEEVLDAIYDAMYGKSYMKALESYAVGTLKHEIKGLKSNIKELENALESSENKRKLLAMIPGQKKIAKRYRKAFMRMIDVLGDEVVKKIVGSGYEYLRNLSLYGRYYDDDDVEDVAEQPTAQPQPFMQTEKNQPDNGGSE